jgi:hypothetical protein
MLESIFSSGILKPKRMRLTTIVLKKKKKKKKDIKYFLTAYAVDDCHTCDISNQAHPKGEGDLS